MCKWSNLNQKPRREKTAGIKRHFTRFPPKAWPSNGFHCLLMQTRARRKCSHHKHWHVRITKKDTETESSIWKVQEKWRCPVVHILLAKQGITEQKSWNWKHRREFHASKTKRLQQHRVKPFFRTSQVLSVCRPNLWCWCRSSLPRFSRTSCGSSSYKLDASKHEKIHHRGKTTTLVYSESSQQGSCTYCATQFKALLFENYGPLVQNL